MEQTPLRPIFKLYQKPIGSIDALKPKASLKFPEKLHMLAGNAGGRLHENVLRLSGLGFGGLEV